VTSVMETYLAQAVHIAVANASFPDQERKLEMPSRISSSGGIRRN